MYRKPAALALSLTAAAGLSIGIGAATAQTADAHLPATKVTTANLPSAGQFTFYDEQATTTRTTKGHPAALPALCQTRSWASLGANAEFTRTYSLSYPGFTMHDKGAVQVASFPSHAAALKAADRMVASLDCKGVTRVKGYMADGSYSVQHLTRTLSNGSTVRVVQVEYGVKGHFDYADAEAIGVTVTGTHAELVSVDFGTQDFYPQAMVKTVEGTLRTLAR